MYAYDGTMRTLQGIFCPSSKAYTNIFPIFITINFMKLLFINQQERIAGTTIVKNVKMDQDFEKSKSKMRELTF